MKKWFTIGILALCSFGVLSAKSYEIVLSTRTKAGSLQLQPGQYSVKVNGTNAVFTDSNAKSYTVPVKVESTDKKFESTRVQTVKSNDGDSMSEIDLGGSKTKLAF